MLLGIVLHGTLTYFSALVGLYDFWPADEDQSELLFVVFDFIHTWRMPTFFLLAGFFAHLVLERRSTSAFVKDRLKRIGLPLLIFGAIMFFAIPFVWIYGLYGSLSLEILEEVSNDTQDLESNGQILFHLWFLYYLLLMYAALIALRYLASFWSAHIGLRLPLGLSLGRYAGYIFMTRLPVALALAAALLLLLRAGNESNPVWPLNVPDVIYWMLFFFYGYALYSRRELIDRLRDGGDVAALLVLAAIVYLVHLALIGAMDETATQGGDVKGLWMIDTLFYGASAAFWSVGLVALFERTLSAPRHWIRWLADSSYWIYIIHLPLVAFFTFFLSHYDSKGSLEAVTRVNWSAEAKFLASCLATAAIGMVTYQYLVRYTPIGTLLNGKKVRPRSVV